MSSVSRICACSDQTPLSPTSHGTPIVESVALEGVRTDASYKESTEFANLRLRKDAILFLDFVDENHDKVLDIQKTYALNQQALEDWRDNVIDWTNDPYIWDFANVVGSNMRHVSFAALLAQIEKVSISILEIIETKRNPIVMMVIDGGHRKSNMWMAQLFCRYIGHRVDLVINDPANIPDALLQQNLIVLHPDDMSYSGLQIHESISPFGSPMGEKLAQSPTTQYVLALGYIATTAENFLRSRIPSLIIPDTVERVKNFDEQLKKYMIEVMDDVELHHYRNVWRTLETYPWSSLYAITKLHTLIYFDHKLADGLSVPSKLLAGPIARNSYTRETRQYRVITNCDDVTYKTDEGKVVGTMTQERDFDTEYTCPRAFYKSIPYTWRGQPLIGDDKLNILEIMRQMDTRARGLPVQ